MRSALVPIPPTPEQRRILAKVNELMALCDQLRMAQGERESTRDRLTAVSLINIVAGAEQGEPNGLEFVLAHFSDIVARRSQITHLRETIFATAVRGRLVAQDESEKTPAKYFGGCQVLGEVPFSLPPSWGWYRVAQIAHTRLGKMLDAAKNTGELRPYLRNVNVRWFDFDLSNLLEMRFEPSELDELALKGGDVIVCEGGEPGRAAVWDERAAGIYFQKAVHRVRFAAGVDSRYFVLALRASANDGRLRKYFTGVTIQHFTGRSLATYLVPLPPLGEQRRIVAKVAELLQFCDQLEASLAARDEARSRLLDAMLAEALGAPAQGVATVTSASC